MGVSSRCCGLAVWCPSPVVNRRGLPWQRPGRAGGGYWSSRAARGGLLVAGRVGSGAGLLFDAGDEFAGGAPSCCAAAGGGAAGGGGEAEHAADAVASAGP